jgi:hypothetical protein
MIDQIHETCFTIKLTSDAELEKIVPGSRLTSDQLIQLARFQLRDSEKRGGVGLTSVASITVAAFWQLPIAIFSLHCLFSNQINQ